MATRRTLHGAPRQVRIIGGVWKRTPLTVANVTGLRPTPDRVRETVFNWLHHLRPNLDDVAGLDLFAGTGALGFELASRGARSVTLVESDNAELAHLRALRERLAAPQIEIIAGDALTVAARLPRSAFDLVFLDPPFAAGLQDAAVEAARPLLASDGLLYLEAPAPLDDDSALGHGLEIVRQARAGRVAFHLLRSTSA